MFFLLRCVFWLGLTFSQIATLEGANSAALLGQGASTASRLALDAAAARCRADPGKCLDVAIALKGADTLNADDRMLSWRLRTE